LNELLKEVFDVYESDTSETLAMADADVGYTDVQLQSTDNADTETEQLSRGLTPRKLRSKDRGTRDKDDSDDRQAACSHDEFHYPGHIPPLKYVFLHSRVFISLLIFVIFYTYII